MTPEQLTALQSIYDFLWDAADLTDGDEHMAPHIDVLHQMITDELNATIGQPLEEIDPT